MPTPTAQSKQLDRIENAIIGNGHEGLLARTARMEENLKYVKESADEAKEYAEEAATRSNELIGKNAEAIDKLSNAMIEMKNILTAHLGTDHLSVMMKKKEFWAVIIFGFVFLHLLATYLPNAWDWLMLVVGLPHLIIPLN